MDIIADHPTFEFMTIAGSVLESKSWNETRVSGGGGGGSHGVYHAHAVSSSTVAHGEMWLRDRDGREHHIRFSGVEVPVRTGHLVTALYGRQKNTKQAEDFTALCYYNHTTGELIRLEAGIETLSYQALPVWRHGGLWFGLLWLMLFISAFSARKTGDGVFACFIMIFIFWFFSWVITRPQVNAIKRKLNKTLDEYVRSLPKPDQTDFAN